MVASNQHWVHKLCTLSFVSSGTDISAGLSLAVFSSVS